ncbi:hypothetical protein D8674_032761 [Pyrus ussuriensis x Pyrus communis]|uniref:Uncharacterized protein n=1 Tax=Pyrus ussuriensis x Pyrus communis TaxID=2448454 RepID=A0A5N5HIZ4_9ROSA|nr:hypothetical protein D8674_032761 [Pyrus ussuriensis x Pyrus communis]
MNIIVGRVASVVAGGVRVVNKQGWPSGDEGRKGGDYNHGDANTVVIVGVAMMLMAMKVAAMMDGGDGYGKVVLPTWW